MRKISKSRTDEEVISSTNGSGSMVTDEQEQQENLTDENEKDPIDVSPVKEDNETEESENPKKTKGKAKGKKKKPERASKKVVEEEYEVEKVIDSKKIKGKLHYLIRWKGYSADSDTWEPENTLSCPDLINKFNDSQKENSKGKGSNSTPKQNKRKSTTKSRGRPKKARNIHEDEDEDEEENDDENAEYEVDRILEVHHKKNGEREFYIHWKGWSNKYDSWEPESNLNCPELIKRFMNKVTVARSTESRNLRVAPETTNRFTLQDPTSGRRLSKRRGQRQRVRYDNAE
ncbi:uncharacterized protein [Epargyreus clarus]|uniref:uncharacterized protein n=1 Tax=Epargyreus clarus TaxID=520877 RepID=UPI003C30C0CE